jgi:hypothetical protein
MSTAIYEQMQRTQQMQAEQMQQMQQMANADMNRQQGVMAARAHDRAIRELAKTKTVATWEGAKVMAVVTLLVLMFSYNQIFHDDHRLFWTLTGILAIALLVKFAHIVKQDGGVALGFYG